MMRSRSSGTAGFSRTGAGGVRLRIASKITPRCCRKKPPAPCTSRRARCRRKRCRSARRAPRRAPARATYRQRSPRRAWARQMLVGRRHGVGKRRGGVGRRTGRHLCQPEVEDLRLAARRDEDVGRLDVAVDDPLRVRRVERIRDLRADVQHARRAASGRPRCSVLQRLALEQLHDDEAAGPRASPMSWMVQMFGWLSAEAARASRWNRSTARGSRDELGRQELQRDAAAEPHVLGPIDDAHAAAAELLEIR